MYIWNYKSISYLCDYLTHTIYIYWRVSLDRLYTYYWFYVDISKKLLIPYHKILYEGICDNVVLIASVCDHLLSYYITHSATLLLNYKQKKRSPTSRHSQLNNVYEMNNRKYEEIVLYGIYELCRNCSLVLKIIQNNYHKIMIRFSILMRKWFLIL